MKSHWRFWIRAKSEEKAQKVLQTVFKKAFSNEITSDPKFAPYPKIGGFTATFLLERTNISWEMFVYEMIRLGQLLGYNWSIAGIIEQQCDGFTHQTSIAGLEAINWACDRPLEI